MTFLSIDLDVGYNGIKRCNNLFSRIVFNYMRFIVKAVKTRLFWNYTYVLIAITISAILHLILPLKVVVINI